MNGYIFYLKLLYFKKPINKRVLGSALKKEIQRTRNLLENMEIPKLKHNRFDAFIV